jgi:hypothetical protein
MRNNWMITQVQDKASNDHDYFNFDLSVCANSVSGKMNTILNFQNLSLAVA